MQAIKEHIAEKKVVQYQVERYAQIVKHIGLGEKVPVEDTWDTEQAEVILTFTKTESIDALIAELQDVKAMMNGSYPFENGRVMQKDLDFDAFIRREDIEDEQRDSFQSEEKRQWRVG